MDFLFQPEPIIWLQQALGHMSAVPFHAFSLFGSPWGVLLVLGLALWLWGWRTVLMVAGVVAVEGLLRTLITQLVPVARPTAEAIVKFEHVATSSFPSGHLATAAALWGVLSALKHVPWWGTALVVLGSALARLYLGVHYVADLVGAVVLAALVVWAVLRVETRVRGWFRRRSFAFYAGIAAVLFALAIASFWFYVESNHVLWTGAGLVAGAALSLPLTYRWVRYRPGTEGWRATLGILALGLSGVVAMMLVDRLTGENSLALGAAAAFLGAVWALLITPLILRLRGAGENVAPERGEPARRVARTLAGATGLIVLVLTWSAGIEPRFILDVNRETVVLPDLAKEWDGVRVALIADFQTGMWLENGRMVDEVVERLVRERPDIVLFAGDLVYHAGEDPEVEVSRAVRRLEPLREAGLATFAVLGNHDWGLDTDQDEAVPAIAAAVEEGLTNAGFRVLTNEATALTTGGRSPLFVVGIGSAYAESDDPSGALDGVPATAPRIVFMHNPSSFAEMPPRSAPLALAGHTHGGQFRVPLLPSWSWMTFVRADPVHADGWIDEYGAAGNRLYVNRGIGFSILPLRLNCSPELTVFTLRGPDPAGRPG